MIDRLVYHLDGVACPTQGDIPFYKKQHRMVLENCGRSDAEDIEEYIAKGGYAAFEKALFEMTDEEICQTITDSGLRGRGGGGFPTGRKWESARRQKVSKKFVVCNGDEGDPGAFMDRSVMNVYHSVSREQVELYLYKLTYDLLIGVVEEMSQEIPVRDEDKKFIADFYKFAFVGLMLDWIRGDMV